MVRKLRRLETNKIPVPHFQYDEFHNWLAKPHLNFAIEIGCGVGLHPILWATKNPQSKILAIERTKNKFQKFLGRLTHHPHLQNIYAAHADASQLLPHLFDKPLVDAYYILYPNPYPKTRQKNLRVAYSPLSHFLVQTLKHGGTLTVATNLPWYAEELRIEIPLQHKLSLIEDHVLSTHSVARSHFELKYLKRNDLCQNLVFRR